MTKQKKKTLQQMGSQGRKRRMQRGRAPRAPRAPVRKRIDRRTDELLLATSEGREAIVDTEGLPIARRDVASLRDGGWLTDDVINAFLQVITRGSQCLAVSSFLYTKLEGGDDVRRWVKGSITGYAKILLPIHEGVHWTLAIIEPGAGLITHYDSLNGCSERSAVHHLLEQWFCRKARKTSLQHACSADPEQLNGYDCGVFVCMRALHEVSGAVFSQADIPLGRRIIAHTILIGLPDALKAPHVKLSDALIDPHADALLAASGGDASEITVSRGEAIMRRDLRSLLPNGWLTSVVINAYMKYLQALHTNSFIINTHFFQRLTSPSYDYSRVRRWARAADIDCDKVIMPVNYADVHWTLVVIQPRVRRVTHYDPLGFHAQQVQHDVTRCVADMPWGPANTRWKQVRSSTPRQDGTDDSGVFICMRALYEVVGAAPGFSQSDVPYARRAIAQAVLASDS